MKTFITNLFILGFCFTLYANGSWLFKKPQPPTITFPNKEKLAALFAKEQLSSFAEQTGAINKLANHTFEGPEIYVLRKLIIRKYEGEQQPKTSFSKPNTKDPDNFSRVICSLVKKNKRLYKAIIKFQQDLEVLPIKKSS